MLDANQFKVVYLLVFVHKYKSKKLKKKLLYKKSFQQFLRAEVTLGNPNPFARPCNRVKKSAVMT
jgi:hypothetical protein